MFLPLASKKNITLNYTVESNIPQYLEGDILRIKQIITNLLSNAIKFTSENGEINFLVSYSDATLHVSVKDNGIGIKEEALTNIFQKFTQADSSTTRKFGGTGLGLSISQYLVELFGGKFEVKSIYGKGSNFSFTIPLVEAKTSLNEDEDEDENEEKSEATDLSGKILLVEDNKTNQMLMQIILQELHLDVTLANDGVEAVEKFKEGSFDLILMDENMPNMNGIEATKIILELQSKNEFRNTPIIALTADAVDGAKEKYLQAGMQEYLTKPLDEDKLLKVLQRYLQK